MQARSSIFVAAGLAALGVAGAAAWLARPATSPGERPSVLVILWDTVRADRMSVYGYDRPTTPRLEALAAESVVYERAISPGMWTVPAHGSLFTGLPASSHGARVGWLWLDEHHVTLAEHFGAHGYETFAWSSNPYLSEQTNLLQGFATQRFSWRGDDGARAAEATRAKLLEADRSVEISPGWAPDGHEGWPEHLTAYKDGGAVIGDSFLSWVDTLGEERPFFAYLYYLEAHHPRVPSLEARRAVSDAPTIDKALATDMSLFRIMSAMEDRASFDEAELAAMSATYDATLVDLDAATGALLDGLAARGRLDDTIVVLVSDHGEHLGEHGMFDHRWSVGQELLHVPLIVHWPRGLEPGRVREPVSAGHLFGTLLALTGLPAPAVEHPLPELGAEAGPVAELVAPTPRLPQIRQAWPDLPPRRWQRRYQARIDGDLKYVRTVDGSESLFDLASDPGEHRSVLAERPADATRLREALKAWDRRRPRYDPSRRTPADRPGNPLEADAGLARQLELLGYTHDEEGE